MAGATPSDFLHLFETLVSLDPLWPRIHPGQFNHSTMTILAESDQQVKLKEMAQLDHNQNLKVLLQTGAIHKDCPPAQLAVKWRKHRKRKRGEFGNQVTLAFQSWSKRSIKIFSKGGIHITGVKNATEFDRLARVIGGLLFAVGAIESRWQLGPPKVVMCNFNWAIGQELSLRALSAVLLETLDIVCSHETETHPALMIDLRFDPAKPNEKPRVMIFRSGKVLISSRNQLAGVLAAYRLICQTVNDNLDRVKAAVELSGKASKKPAKPKRVLEGYPSGQSLPTLPKRAKT